MTKTICFFSDPHLGLTRNSHTTPASRDRLKDEVYGNALIPTDTGADHVYCLGDMFDTHQNDANTLVQAYGINELLDGVLIGNHDVSNRADKLSTLQAILDCANCIDSEDPEADPTLPTFDEHYLVRFIVTMVHHKMTQSLFVEALENRLKEGDDTHPGLLLLHCNYDSPFATDESTLNLTKEMAERLLKVFDYILIGHEHQYRTDFGGRLIVTGNTHPTSFSDIGDKYIHFLRFENDRFYVEPKQLIWSAAEKSRVIQVTSEDDIKVEAGVQFYDFVGKVEQKDLPGICKRISEVWKESDDLLMVRNQVTAIESLDALDVSHVQELESVPAKITGMLKGTELEAVWKEYLDQVEAV